MLRLKKNPELKVFLEEWEVIRARQKSRNGHSDDPQVIKALLADINTQLKILHQPQILEEDLP